MDLSRAAQLVALDHSDTDDIATVSDAIAHVLNILRLPEEPFVAGSYPLDEDGSELSEAYRLVLEAGNDSTAEAIAAEAGAKFSAEYVEACEGAITADEWARFDAWLDDGRRS